MRRSRSYRPFASQGRHAIAAILLTVAVCSAVSVALSM
jgi:hypothetical protein